MNVNCCWVGSARYRRPLDRTTASKFRALSSLGQNYVIGFANDYHAGRFSEQAQFYLLPQLPVAFLRYVTLLTIGALLSLWLVLTRRVDVLIAQSPYEGAAAAVAKQLAALCGRRVALIVESHGDFERSLFLQRHISFAAPYRWLMQRGVRYALGHADALRAVSQSTRAQLLRAAPGKPIVQFPTWTDIEVFFDAPRSEPPSTSQVILYVGVMTPLKGLHFLLHAFADMTESSGEARLVLVGKAEDASYTQKLKDSVERLGLAERVMFAGALPQVQVAQHMIGARVLVLPSLTEGLPRVVIEAMACGTPVIASQVGGLPELIEDGATGRLVPAGDVQALTDALHWALTSGTELDEMSCAANEAARKLFSTSVYVSGYQQLLEIACDTLAARTNKTRSQRR